MEIFGKSEEENLDRFFCGIGLSEAGRQGAEHIIRQFPQVLTLPLLAPLFEGKAYEKGIEAAHTLLGADADGMKLFVYLCRCAVRTHADYAAKGIGEAVYWDTMKFLSRFLADDARKRGTLAFRWGWWFPRQLSMREFRLGALEYEMTEEDCDRKIYLHIPSDADLSERSVTDSVAAAKQFFTKYYPAYAQAEMDCDSWMLVPTLRDLLPASSNILKFQRRFRILRTEEDSTAFLEWIYPDPAVAYEALPEQTSLQRSVKRHLLAGGKLGWALGKFLG